MDDESKAKYREYARKRRERLNYFIDVKCILCGDTVQTKKYNEAYAKRKGLRCKKCLKKISSKTLKNLRDSQSPEEKSLKAREARAKVKNSTEAVKKQWKTIKSLPKEQYERFIEKRSSRMKKIWNEVFSEEKRNNIISSLVSSNNCGRSKISEVFKQKLIENNLYDGFISEQPFHGFVPDEINHELKIIIEVFGDVYHCNPKKYTDENEYVPVIQRTVLEQRTRDNKKIAAYYRNGYDVIIVWESCIYNDIDNEIKKVHDAIDKKRNIK